VADEAFVAAAVELERCIGQEDKHDSTLARRRERYRQKREAAKKA